MVTTAAMTAATNMIIKKENIYIRKVFKNKRILKAFLFLLPLVSKSGKGEWKWIRVMCYRGHVCM